MFMILEEAEKGNWILARFGKSQTSNDKIEVDGRKIGDSPELLDAFDVMLEEFSWIRHYDGIYYKVSTTGREALKLWREGANPLTNQQSPPAVQSITFHNYGPSINVSSGSSVHHIEQINSHLRTLSENEPDLANNLAALTQEVEVSEIPPTEKEEALDRINELSAELSKPERKSWKIKEKIQGLLEFTGKGADTAGRVGEAYVKLQPLIEFLKNYPGN